MSTFTFIRKVENVRRPFTPTFKEHWNFMGQLMKPRKEKYPENEDWFEGPGIYAAHDDNNMPEFILALPQKDGDHYDYWLH